MKWISIEDRTPENNTTNLIMFSCDCPPQTALFLKDQGFISNVILLCEHCFDNNAEGSKFLRASSNSAFKNVSHWHPYTSSLQQKDRLNAVIDETIENLNKTKSLCPEFGDEYDQIISGLRKKQKEK